VNFSRFDGLVWLLALLGPFIFIQRRLHRELQSSLLLLTRRGEVTLALFSLIFLPGVLLHELSHYFVAGLLGVRASRFSVLPRITDEGRLQLGYVETTTTDLVRDALIGTAPLVIGGIFVTYAGIVHLGLGSLWEAAISGDTNAVWENLSTIPVQPDFWLWFYLIFAVSSTMLPSVSDRRAWLPIGLVIGILIVLVLIAGAGPWLLENLADPLNIALRALAIIIGISLAIHIVLFPLVWIVRRILTRLTGFEVI
jgi:hypothetical protein